MTHERLTPNEEIRLNRGMEGNGEQNPPGQNVPGNEQNTPRNLADLPEDQRRDLEDAVRNTIDWVIEKGRSEGKTDEEALQELFADVENAEQNQPDVIAEEASQAPVEPESVGDRDRRWMREYMEAGFEPQEAAERISRGIAPPASQAGTGGGQPPRENPPAAEETGEPDPEDNEDIGRDEMQREELEQGNDEELDHEIFQKWKNKGATDEQALRYTRRGMAPLALRGLRENVIYMESIIRDQEIPPMPDEAYDWLQNHGIDDSAIKNALDNLKKAHDTGLNVNSGTLNGVIRVMEAGLARGRIQRTDPRVRSVLENLESMREFRISQELSALPPEERRRLEEEMQGRRRGSENPYDPPASLEDLIYENVKYAPIEYRIGSEKALLYPVLDEKGREKKDSSGKTVYRVNFENFTKYIDELAMTRGAVSPRSEVNYFGVLKLRKGYNSFSLEDILLYDETATLFLPNREEDESEEHYLARAEAYKGVRNNLSSNLWIRMNDRGKHMLLEYSGDRGSDEKYENGILKSFNDNVPIRSSDLQTRLNLSNALAFSPEVMDKKIEIIMAKDASDADRNQKLLGLWQQGFITDANLDAIATTLGGMDSEHVENLKRALRENNIEAISNLPNEKIKEYIGFLLRQLDDNFDGQTFRRGFSAYAHLNDVEALKDILGEDSVFFYRHVRDALPEEARDFVKDLDGATAYLENQEFREEWFDENGRLKMDRGAGMRRRFVNVINIFNLANKPIFTMEAVQERMIVALAQKAHDRFDQKYRETIQSRIVKKNEESRAKMEEDSSRGLIILTESQITEAVNKELWKIAFDTARYNHEDSYYWTSFGGLNTGDNDPGAAAFRAKSKIDNFWQYMKKQYRDRGQLAGNIYLGGGVTRLSTSMANALQTLDGRSILDVVEGRQWKGGDTSKFDFEGSVDNVTFRQDAMSFLADNHYRRVFKWFREAIDNKTLSFENFVERDKSRFGDGRFVVDKVKAANFFGALKDWRYIFNEIPMDQKVRVIIGEDKNGEYIYEERYMAEAFFTKELLHDYIAKEDIWRAVTVNENYEVNEDIRAKDYYRIAEEDEKDADGKIIHKEGDRITMHAITPVNIYDANGELKYKSGSEVPAGTIIHKMGDVIQAGQRLYTLDVKKGDLDHGRFNDGWIWKSFTKYYIMAEIMAHRNKADPASYYDGRVIDEIFDFLEILPMEADWGNPKNDYNDRRAQDAHITKFFFNHHELKWMKETAHASDFAINLEEIRYTAGAGLMEGLFKAFINATGVEQALKGK